MPVPQRVCFFGVVCSHVEQARCLFHKESVLLWGGPESPSLWKPRIWLQRQWRSPDRITAYYNLNKNALLKLALNFIYNFAIAQIAMPPVAAAILTIFAVPARIGNCQ